VFCEEGIEMMVSQGLLYSARMRVLCCHCVTCPALSFVCYTCPLRFGFWHWIYNIWYCNIKTKLSISVIYTLCLDLLTYYKLSGFSSLTFMFKHIKHCLRYDSFSLWLETGNWNLSCRNCISTSIQLLWCAVSMTDFTCKLLDCI
jgi:hypothetical protein